MKTAGMVSMLVALLLGFSLLGGPLTAQDEATKEKDEQKQQEKQKAAKKSQAATQVKPKSGLMYRASVVTGMKVWNPQGEELGEVEDLMIDFDNGQIVYAAVAHGGTAGIGEKLIAVPWKGLKVKQAKGEYFLELNAPKEQLQNAEGFDKDNWPLEANQTLLNKS